MTEDALAWAEVTLDDAPVGDRSSLRRSVMSPDPELMPPPAPKPVRREFRPNSVEFDQVEGRERRRRGLEVEYTAFDLLAEVEAVCRPLAERVSAVMCGPVVLTERGMVTEVIDGRATVSVDSGSQYPALSVEVAAVVAAVALLRDAVITALSKASPKSRLAAAAGVQPPEVTLEALQTQSWVGGVVALVSPLSSDLAALVASSSAPRGHLSVISVQLQDALRPLDSAARDLDRRILVVAKRAAFLASVPALSAADEERRERERAQARMAKLGLV